MKEGPAVAQHHVIVIGSGVAGTAAAIAAASLTASVVILDGGSGASSLATGAIDHVFWEACREAPAPALSDGATAVLAALAAYVVPPASCSLVTTAGVVRRADGHDAGLLDVAPSGAGAFAVVECSRPGWNARELARSWGDRYVPLETSPLRYTDESRLPDADFAARHDDADRVGWLAERLRLALARANARWAGVVLPPMLGIDRSQAEALSRRVGLACGEAVGTPGGPAGLRFERARDRALAGVGATKVMTRAKALAASDEMWRVSTEDGQTLSARSVVVATGGLIGGGLAYAPSEALLATALPSRADPPMRLTLDAPLLLGAHGRKLDTAGSLFGFAPESLAEPFSSQSLLETVGVLAQRMERAVLVELAPRGLFAAGEVVADAPRTWLGALSQGAQAGALAARAALAMAEATRGKAAATPATLL